MFSAKLKYVVKRLDVLIKDVHLLTLVVVMESGVPSLCLGETILAILK